MEQKDGGAVVDKNKGELKMEVKNDLVPELELNIIPSKGNNLQVELMNEDFVEYLKKKSILKDDCVFITLRELKPFIERLQKAYKEYCEE